MLEFQLTSNVRLNNLNALENHPLHEYLKAGIPCVQGTDGAALYGTNPIDEQLSLEKLLELSGEELLAMKRAETAVIDAAQAAFQRKSFAFRRYLQGRTLTDCLLAEMEREQGGDAIRLHRTLREDANTALSAQIRELPWDAMPVVVAGGSFNTEKRSTKGFRVFAIVPSRITAQEARRLREAGTAIRVSTESEGAATYKSFNYEIFERRPSLVVCLDGNSAAENLIQEAKNGKGKAAIFVWERAAALRKKALSLEGYVRFFGEGQPLSSQIGEAKERLFAPQGVDTSDWYQTHREGSTEKDPQ